MAGHSKWASIKHKKKATDAKRGAAFTKLARAIQVAAREGGGDPDGQRRARPRRPEGQGRVACPRTTSSARSRRARGADQDADAIEAVIYEGYGPGGVALLVEALTDNRNRTGSEVRHAFTKSGGNLGEPGSVAWQFEKKGELRGRRPTRYSEDDLMPAIDAGAEDISLDEDVFEVVTAPADLTAVREALEGAGVELESAELAMRPTSRVEVDEADAGKLMRLIEHARGPRRRARGPRELRRGRRSARAPSALTAVSCSCQLSLDEGVRRPTQNHHRWWSSSASIPAPPTPAMAWSLSRGQQLAALDGGVIGTGRGRAARAAPGPHPQRGSAT